MDFTTIPTLSCAHCRQPLVNDTLRYNSLEQVKHIWDKKAEYFKVREQVLREKLINGITNKNYTELSKIQLDYDHHDQYHMSKEHEEVCIPDKLTCTSDLKLQYLEALEYIEAKNGN